MGTIIGCNIFSCIGGISFSSNCLTASSISFVLAFSIKSFFFGNYGNGNLIDGLNCEPIDGFFCFVCFIFNAIDLPNLIAG